MGEMEGLRERERWPCEVFPLSVCVSFGACVRVEVGLRDSPVCLLLRVLSLVFAL